MKQVILWLLGFRGLSRFYKLPEWFRYRILKKVAIESAKDMNKLFKQEEGK